MAQFLIVDDDSGIRRTLELHLTHQGHDVVSAGTGAEAQTALDRLEPNIIVLDLKLPDTDGLTLLESFRDRIGQAAVVMITAHQDMPSAVRAMQLGAFDYVHKPLDIDELDSVFRRILDQQKMSRRLHAFATEVDQPGQMIGRTRGMLEVFKAIGRVSSSRVTVLVTGETGTGKELVARAIHQATSPDEPFVSVNCSAVVETLLESELMGHEKGAFTGADQQKIGKLEFAGAGTVFFDEISEMPTELQAKLLRVLQEREFERVGGNKTIRFEARVIAATNRDLETMIDDKAFRQDLYYRLCVTRIGVPPLRERKDDVPLLVDHLLSKINRNLHTRVAKVPEDVMKRLCRYDWPGNVRELENVLARSAVLSAGEVLQVAEDFSRAGRDSSRGEHAGRLVSLEELECEHIQHVLNATGGHFGQACEILGISRPTLRHKLERYGLKDSFKSD